MKKGLDRSDSSVAPPPSSISGPTSKARRPGQPGLHGEDGPDGQGADGELLERRSSNFEAGIFGVLFTLSKENSESHITLRWVLLKVLLDAWQLFTTVVNPDFGWAINSDGTPWKVVAVLNFGWLSDLGYTWYLVLMYGAIVLLAANLALCVWVAWSFKEQKFDYLWPIRFLRLFTSVFFQAFDVASLNLLQLGISCMYTGPQGPHLHMQLFPAQSCSTMPQLAHAVVSGLALAVFIAIALLLNMAEVEVNPASRRPLALGHSGAEVAAFALKALLTLVGVFLGWPRVAAVAYLLLSLALAWQYYRWSPNLVAWVNWLKSGVAGGIAYCALLQVVLVFLPGTEYYNGGHAGSSQEVLTLVLLAGMLPAFLASAALARWMLVRETRSALQAFKTVEPGVKPQDIYPFSEPRDVERIARSCRVWTDRYNLDKEAVARAEEVIKAGLVIFPSHAFMALVYANFMMDVLGVSQSGSRQLENARKLSPSLMCRFMLFVRQQQATQKAAGNTSGGSGSMDLLGYVEYQRKQRMVVRHHKEALMAMAAFWKLLDAPSVSFTALSKALAAIEKSVSQAETAYRVVLEAYGSSPRLVRLYAKFLEGIKNDPWGAAEYNAEAERLEEAKDGDGQGPMLPDGTPLSRMDELSTAVIVTNAFGDIQMANRRCHALFGYRKGELEGKNVTVLMPAHQAQTHTAHLRKHIDASGAERIAFKRTVLGMHRERVAFPLRIEVSRSSGTGEDSIFIGLMEPLPGARGTSTLWVASGGTIACCDPSFVSMFGHLPEDVIGSRLDTLLSEDGHHDSGGVQIVARIIKAGDGPAGAAGGGRGKADLILADNAEPGAGQNPDEAVEAEGEAGPRRAKDDSAHAGAGLAKGRSALLDWSEGNDGDSSSIVERLLAAAASSAQKEAAGSKANVTAAATAPCCLLVHKYDMPLQCSVTATAIGLQSTTPLFEVKVSLASREPQLLMVVGRKGNIKHMSGDLAGALGATAGGIGAGAGGGHGAHSAQPAADGAAGAAGGAAAAAAAAHHGGVSPSLQDFLPAHLRDLSSRYFKELGSPTVMPDTEGIGARMPLGPTLELLSTRGRPVHVRASTTPLELPGERCDVIRMAPSSLEEGLAARRLGLRVSPEGVILAVDGAGGRPAGQSHMFDLVPETLIGRRLWEVVPMASDGASTAAAAEDEVLAAKDDLAHELAAATGSFKATAAERDALKVFDGLVQRSLEAPGGSWRVAVVPPGASPAAKGPAAASGAAGADPKLAAALLARRSKAAVMQMDVSLDGDDATPGGGAADGRLSISVHLWTAESMTAVVQLDAMGRVVKIYEEKLRPVGLLFGLPHADILGEPLASLVQLAPGVKVPADLLSEGPAKKSAMKSKGKDKDANTVGPLHKLQASHRDGMPLTLQVQVIGKLGRGPQPLVALLRVHNPAPPRPDALAAALAGKTARHAAVLPLTQLRDPLGSGSGAGKPAQPAALKLHPAAPPMPAALLGSGLALPGMVAPRAAAALGAAAAALKKGDQGSGSGGSVRPSTPTVAGEHAGLPAGRVLSLKATPVAKPNAAAAAADPLEALMHEIGGPEGKAVPVPAAPKPGTPRAGAALGVNSPRASARLGGVPNGALDADGDHSDVGDGKSASGAASSHEGEEDEAKDDRDGAGSEGGGVGAVALGPAKHDRISDWVASKGERYQNQGGARDPAAASSRGSSRLGSPGAVSASRRNPLAAGASGVIAHPRALAPPPLAGHGGAPGGGKDAGGGDDAASVGGDSHTSGQSGYSAVSGASSSGGVEYKRGKRFRKLVQLMDSPQAQQVLMRLKRHSWLIVIMLVVVHVVAFAMMTTSINSQADSMTHLAYAGYTQRYLLRALMGVRVLDQIVKGRAVPNLYSPSELDYYANDVLEYATLVKDLNNKVLISQSNGNTSVYKLYYFDKVHVWAGYNTSNNNSDVMANLSLWDMATRVYTEGKSVYQNYREWAANGTDIAATVPGHFLLYSAPQWYSGYRKILDASLYDAVNETAHVNQLQLIFLVIEGAVVCSMAAAYLVYLLRAVAQQRYVLYETFLAIPLGLTRALASQNTNLLDEEEEDEDGDEDEQPDVKKEGRGASFTQQGQQGNSGNLIGGVSGKPRRAQMDASVAAGSEHGGKRGATVRRSASSGLPVVEPPAHAGASGWFQGLKKRFRRRSSGVQPLGSKDVHGSSSKRMLRRDSRDTLFMLAPFLVWSILIISIYAVDYVQLSSVADEVASESLANFQSARTYRAAFFAHELAAETRQENLPDLRAALKHSAVLLRDAFYTLELGADAFLTLGNDTERFPLVKQGLAFFDHHTLKIFFDNKDCMRLEEHLPCPGPDYRYYEVTHVGLDSMMQQYLHELFMMSDEVTNASYPGLANPRLDFIFNVGTKDLNDANVRLSDAHLTDIHESFSAVLLLHIFLFVLLFVVFGFFIVVMLYPLLKRMRKEKRRIAELMSQLPLELDVEKLVAVALGTANGAAASAVADRSNGSVTDNAFARKLSKSASMGGAANMALEDADVNNAAKQWKNILKQANVSSTGRRSSVVVPT